MFEPPPQVGSPFAKILASVVAHCGVLALLIHAGSSKPVREVALPGTAAGSHVDLMYLPGRATSQTSSKQSSTARPQIRSLQTRSLQPVPAASPIPKPAEDIKPSAATLTPPPRPHFAFRQTPTTLSDVPASATSDATAASDSLGNGNLQIALTTYSPSPRPDLSQLPRGMQGDVVLDVTIDPNGKVAEVAVVRAIGYGIDEAVINTVRTWLFRPATRDGVPVASGQDVLFHFGPV